MKFGLRTLTLGCAVVLGLTLAQQSTQLQRALPGAAVFADARASLNEHQRLRLRNTFKTPEEVVSYYCARDASGFVWSGLLEAERRAFTTWQAVPQFDSFYIAQDYKVLAAKPSGARGDTVTVEVRYELTAMGDAHGSRSPAPKPYSVHFNLKRIDGVWKISKPDSGEIPPVVLESKFFSGNKS